MSKQIIEEFIDKKVLIWGLGKEGISTYKFLKKHLPHQVLYLCDSNTPDKNDFKEDIIVSEGDLLLENYDLIMKAPGIISYDRKGNIQTQAGLFLKYFSDQVIGITGTKGKSTTASLMYHVLKENYPSTFLVGNIGVPCFDIIDEMFLDSIVVFELSCHQLEYSKYSPKISVLLNLFEEHLDHYESYEKYKLAKKQIILNQNENDIAIADTLLKNEFSEYKNIIWSNDEIYVKGNTLYNKYDHVLIEENPLIGKHNLENMAIVYYISHVYFGISNINFKNRIKTFKPLSHRLENIGTIDGITYINDSISTIGESTINAIKSLENIGTILIGGMDRHIDYNSLIEYLKTAPVDNIILMYDTGLRIYNFLHQNNVYYVNDLKEAMKLAKKITKKGKICLLSPAAASYGYFKDFVERGNEFIRLANEL